MSGKYIGPMFRKSAAQMRKKELGSLINMLSKSKPYLPFLFVAGGLTKLTRSNLASEEDIEKFHFNRMHEQNPQDDDTQALEAYALVQEDIAKRAALKEKEDKENGIEPIEEEIEPDSELTEQERIENDPYYIDYSKQVEKVRPVVVPALDFDSVTILTDKRELPFVRIQY